MKFIRRAHIRPIMITGDNLLTALSVARECGIIKPTKRAYIVETANVDDKLSGARKILVLKQAYNYILFLFLLKELHSLF